MKIIKKGNTVWLRHWFKWYCYDDNHQAIITIMRMFKNPIKDKDANKSR